jgi:hypothetical protein
VVVLRVEDWSYLWTVGVGGGAGLRDAGFRHDRDGAGEEVSVPSRPDAPSDCPDSLCW